ncbi:hypothetical protein ACFWYE_02005 [Mesorhizobium sp. NPDC059025]
MTLRTGRGSSGSTYRDYTCSTKARQRDRLQGSYNSNEQARRSDCEPHGGTPAPARSAKPS